MKKFLKLICVMLMTVVACFTTACFQSGSGNHGDSSTCQHAFGEWKTVDYPSCEKAGTRKRICISCGLVETEKLAAIGHDWLKATCLTAKTCKTCGITEGTAMGHEWREANCAEAKKCVVCGVTEGVCLGHSFGDWTETRQATCGERGLRERVCSVCEETEYEYTPTLVHTWQKATCVTPKLCTTCGETEGSAYGHNYVNKICTACGDSIYKKEGNCIYFGNYPQTLKASNVTITDTVNEEGYYLGTDGEYYAKVTVKRYIENDVKFSNGETIIPTQSYYFKVEPLKWRILLEKNGKAFLLCESIIDAKAYDDDSNVYEYSQIRAWLNETFYEIAFSELQKTLVKEVLVDNSATSTNPNGQAQYWNDGINENVCAKTLDKVFLLSQQEITNTEYGFSSVPTESDAAKQLKPSDYALANCALTQDNGFGYWWLRSPSATKALMAQSVGDDYETVQRNTYLVQYFYFGVVPALWIEL